MTPSTVPTMALCAATMLAAGCALPSAPPPALPPAPTPVLAPADVPVSVRAPLGQSLFLEAFASGAQLYECTAKSGQATGFAWAFRGPEATLADRAGRTLGKHYAGPTWESVDGSTVVGEVKASDPGPDASAIPWLLLSVKSTTGAGVFTQTKSIQRLQTVGGVSPSQDCGVANAGQIAKVAYRATYRFYRVGA